ncbi:nuclear transport factor 2 family protein [Rhodococcus sp. D2-41]|uniref:Nuclear transport factor 2 family protein n=1 Tax=Speluncibacter jeojiensis TaxID=2710754 RepID=A0A9X4RDS3_9ACTN|nr:nuclear transport factor 2 family protein [Rhodococcus sp. D2-41]MDG3011504.1 nuclear transport factor 2 family protein [Rhodococcus sp. D2-41]MDG3015140.1 nuclear transport factor 2 family protein [Corynebacteriales bacterium D3-21]
MKSLQEISDRMEIEDLLVDYCHAIDTRDWSALDAIFTSDAVIDYTATGGIAAKPSEIKEFLATALSGFAGFQHMIGASRIRIDGDSATARTICHNPMVLDSGSGQKRVMFVGLWYVDDLVRTEAGWRITHRREELSFFHNAPGGEASQR